MEPVGNNGVHTKEHMMKFSNRTLLACLLATIACGEFCYAQFGSTGLGGSMGGIGGLGGGTSGLGGTGGLGGTSGLGGGIGGTGATAQRLPGSFGGPGITGVGLLELSTLRAVSNQSGPSQFGVQGATSPLGATGGSTGGASPFGATAFGGNAFGTSGGIGGFGSSGLGGIGSLGGGFGGGLGGGGLGGVGSLGGLGSRTRGATGTGANANQRKVRAVVRPDFSNVPDAGAEAPEPLAAFEGRMSRLPVGKRMQSVTASIQDGQVTLTGTVATESDKKLAERLMMLEPGVRSVKNQLMVGSMSAEKIEAVPSR